MLKKILCLTVAVVLLALCAVPASAATKADLMTELRKTTLSDLMLIEAENFLRGADFTAAECDAFVLLIRECAAVVPDYKGPSAHSYTTAQRTFVIDKIKEACNLVGYSFKFATAANPKHANDIVFLLYDNTGKLVFSFDGDLVKYTGGSAAKPVSDSAMFLFVGLAFLTLSGAAFFGTKKLAVCTQYSRVSAA